MYTNILVAYDGSDGSRLAFEKALEFKKALPHIQLSIIYVNEEDQESTGFMEAGNASAPVVSARVDSNYAQFMPPEIGEKRYKTPHDFVDTSAEYSKHMHNAIQQQLDAQDVSGTVLALEGNAAKTIPAFIEEQKIDLLLIGNSGKSGLQRFFVGSMSKKLLKESPCSVLVVK
ncbi:universal stress protein [Planomicrobium sp. CPCC 101079]|uniref:universal stress protein n=1 Tax=Planomicrobium sp. CPCC 101079 TaxID=2599618 RepID=UPI0011B623CA|nr:universal stress protein [Planomicrobium sp. CPCC 101079]TWT11146.1 universal stress protein [Planomicrobium sp. CPCC 101079]